jgi:predicted polyphosphate/ATP-dependent NAD kinase
VVVNVGVLLNPIAGFGGTLALHGTDALPASRFEEAVASGHAERRLIRAIGRFRSSGGDAELFAAPGLLGAGPLMAAGIAFRSGDAADPGSRTTRHDTIAAARQLVAMGIDALLFAGGDGTATDLAEAIGEAVPVIGVPSGVKMHSQVFARSPESAGRLLAEFAAGRATTELADVLDVGTDGTTDVIAALVVPMAGEPLQGAKVTSRRPGSAAANRAIAQELLASDEDDVTWIIGPGTTTAAVAAELGFAATLRGVDVRHPSGALEHDVTEERLYEVAAGARHPRLVLGVVGGQGFLLGRGNQEISTRVVEAIGADRVEIVAAEDKVGGLVPPVLLIDAETGDGPDGGGPAGHPLLGYRRVRTGARQSTVMRVEAA